MVAGIHCKNNSFTFIMEKCGSVSMERIKTFQDKISNVLVLRIFSIDITQGAHLQNTNILIWNRYMSIYLHYDAVHNSYALETTFVYRIMTLVYILECYPQ